MANDTTLKPTPNPAPTPVSVSVTPTPVPTPATIPTPMSQEMSDQLLAQSKDKHEAAYNGLRPVQKDLVRSYAEVYMQHVESYVGNNSKKDMARQDPNQFVEIYSKDIANLMVRSGMTGPDAVKAMEKNDEWMRNPNYVPTPMPLPTPAPDMATTTVFPQKPPQSQTPLPPSGPLPNMGPLLGTASTLDGQVPVEISPELKAKISHASKGLEICATVSNGNIKLEECAPNTPPAAKGSEHKGR